MWSVLEPKWSSTPPISSPARPSSSMTPNPTSSVVPSSPATTVRVSAYPQAQFCGPHPILRPLIFSMNAPFTLRVQACSCYGPESRAPRPRFRCCPPPSSRRESTSSGSPYGGTRRHTCAPLNCWSRTRCLNPWPKNRTCHSSLTVCTVTNSRAGT